MKALYERRSRDGLSPQNLILPTLDAGTASVLHAADDIALPRARLTARQVPRAFACVAFTHYERNLVMSFRNFLTSRWGPILTGAVVGDSRADPGQVWQPRQHGDLRGLLQPRHRGRAGIAPRRGRAIYPSRDHRVCAGRARGALCSSASSSHAVDRLRWCVSCWACSP